MNNKDYFVGCIVGIIFSLPILSAIFINNFFVKIVGIFYLILIITFLGTLNDKSSSDKNGKKSKKR